MIPSLVALAVFAATPAPAPPEWQYRPSDDRCKALVRDGTDGATLKVEFKDPGGFGSTLQKLDDRADDAALAAQCGADFGAFLAVARASCSRDPKKFKAALADPGAFSLPLVAGQNVTDGVRSWMWHASDAVGCARVLTSTDGRLKAWRIPLDPFEDTPGKEAGFLAWRAKDGASVVAQPAGLGNILDVLTPVPGKPDRYLLLRLESRGGTRRIAEVLEVREKSARRVEGTFVVGKKRKDLLEVHGYEADTGKFRHTAVGNLMLTFDPASGEIRAGPYPEGERIRMREGEELATHPIAVLKDGVFVVDPARKQYGALYWLAPVK